MDLTIDNEISKSKANSKEIDDFTKELQNALTKDNSRINSLYNEFLDKIPLATKYENKLSDIIKDTLDALSYEFDFLYFDYDKNQKSYFIDGYSEGNIGRYNMTKKDLEGNHFKRGTFWDIHDNNHIIEDVDLKDALKLEVEDTLEKLEFEKENKVGKEKK